MNTTTNTAKIKHFTDYRTFLLAHIQDCKRRNPRWTFGMFAKQLQLKHASSITKILKGDRDPGTVITNQLIRYFSFSAKETQYFRDLIRLRKIQSDPRLTVLLLEKMGKTHPDEAMKILDNKNFQLISLWYCTAIREMVRLRSFQEDSRWISKKLHFKVTPSEAEHAIELLLQEGLLQRNTQGHLKIAQGRFQTTDDIASEAIRRYHEATLDQAKTAVRKFPVEEREFGAITLNMRADRISDAKELIREFQDRFSKLMEEDSGDTVYQMQLQLFPLTKNNKMSVAQTHNEDTILTNQTEGTRK